jgi:dethiobiotin synthetase
MAKAFFITGTDTGVGKTFATIMLARFYLEHGKDVGVMKPISCGPAKENDARCYIKELKLKDPLSLINPIALKSPLAPYVASKKEKRKINLKNIFDAFEKLQNLHDILLVEGVGGVLVPIKQDYFVIDLIKDLSIPAIIVARAGLGTQNHTLLTVEALKRRRIPIEGIILNGYTGKDLSEKTNAEVIEEFCGIKILAKINR